MKTKVVKTSATGTERRGVGAPIPLDLWSRFKVDCTIRNVTQAEMIETLIREHLARSTGNAANRTKSN